MKNISRVSSNFDYFKEVGLLKMKLRSNKKESNPAKTMRAAERLLKKGDLDVAALYFWSAGNNFRENKEYELSANAYERAAYCHSSEDHWERAVEDYLSASNMYELAGSSLKATAMKGNAEKMKMLQNEET